MTASSRSRSSRDASGATLGGLGCRLLVASLLISVLNGCALLRDHVAYYWQSAAGHLSIVWQAEPIEAMLARADVDPGLRERLERVLQIRAFASRELGLPENDSYTRYVDLKRPFVVWNVFATPELSMQLERWCFPIAGCVTYRGYYSFEAAERYARLLRRDGFESYVGGVPAYSTLGWFDDPVLSSFVNYPLGELARLIFHELAHQVVYVPGDTTFNESFATAVEEAGVARWMQAVADPQLATTYAQHAARKRDFVALLRKYRERLEELYARDLDDDVKRARKRALFDELRADYATLKQEWGGFAGYDRWFAQPLTNAHLASVGTYTQWLPAFRLLLARRDGDLRAFFDDVRGLAALSREDRQARMRALDAAASGRGSAGGPANGADG